MTKRMERQRVLYSAKTKTSKVIPTSSTRRPLSLPASFQTDEHSAPLASVEAEVSLITKRESESHKSAHLSGQPQRPASWTQTCDEKPSNKDVTIWKRESSNKELVRSTPFRSTIKIRNSKTCDLPKHHPSYRGNPKSHRPRSEGVTDVLSSDKISSHRGIRSDSDLSVVHNGANGKVKYTSSTTLNRNLEGNRKPIYGATPVKGNARSYPEKKDVQKTAPAVAPKPKICSKVSAAHAGATCGQLSNTSILESSPVVIRKEGRASSKENHVLTTPSRQDSDNASKPCSRKVHSYQKLQRESPHTNHNTTSSLAKHSEKQCAFSEYPDKELLPEIVSPLNYSQIENGEPPEMSIKPASTTRDCTASSYVTGQYKDHVVQSKSHQRKPLATICITSNTPTSSTEDIHGHSGFNINNTEAARNRHHQNDQNILSNTMYPTDKDPTGIIHAEHDEFDHFLGDDFKPRWKRNSMRLATQGYTSMSDLTESVECLKGHEEEEAKPARSPRYASCADTQDRKPVDTDPEKASSAGTMYDSVPERVEYEKTSNDVSLDDENVEGSNTDMDTVKTSIGSEKPLVTMTRNGMNRLSYRMATTGITNAWTEEGDGRAQSNNNKLSPVTERADGDSRSDHCNLATETSPDSGSHSRTTTVAPNTQSFSSAAYPLDRDTVSYSQTSELSSTTPHLPQSDTEEQQEHLNTIKRRSYLLATTASISDLTFLDAGLDLVDSSISFDNANSERDALNSATIRSQRNKHMTEFHHGQTHDTSCNNTARQPSSKRNSSEINNGNYKSTERSALPESTNGGHLIKEFKEATSRHGPSAPLDASDVDSSDSGNTSCYYSASSDTSFVTADGDPLNSVHSHESKHWSPCGQSSLHQKQRSANQLHTDQMSPRFLSQTHVSHRLALKDQKRDSSVLSVDDRRTSKPHLNIDRSHDRSQDRSQDRSHDRSLRDQHPPALLSPGQRETTQPLPPHHARHTPAINNEHHSWQNTNNSTLSRKANNISQTTKGPKHSSPVNNVLQCYGCGLNDGQSTQTHPYMHGNNSKGILTVGRNRDINSTAHRRHPEDLRKTGAGIMHSESNLFIYPAGLPRNKPIRIRKYPVGPDLLLNQSSSTSGVPSTASFSSISSFADVMPWEETPRFPPSLGRPRRKLYAGFDSQPLPMDSYNSDSSSVFSIQSCGSWGASRSAEVERSSKFHEVTPSIRSVSSFAYGSTRSLSESGDPGYLTDSKNINLYNLYPHFNNLGIEDCLTDSFHGKNFSRESLESFLSDATTIGDNLDHKSDLVNLSTDYPTSNAVQHKNATIVHSEQRTHELSRGDRLNNSCGSELDNTGGKLNGGNFNGNKKLHDISRASSCAPATRPRPTPKGKYLSSKDILDFILTPDKTSKKDTGTLERQAQKVYEAILCCNEVGFQPAREYHF